MEVLALASQHQHRHWHPHCKKIIFAIRIFFKKKVEYLCSSLCLVMVSLPLCYKYLVLYDFLYIQSKASIGVLEKSYWIFGSIHPGVLKQQLLRKFLHTLHTFQRNIQGWVLFKYACRPSRDYSKKLFRAAIRQTGIYPSNLDVRYLVQKKSIF